MTEHHQMIHLIPTIKGAAAICAIAMGGMVGTVFADVITQESPITLGGAIGVGGVVVVGAWYLSARLTKIDARLKVIENHMKTCQYRKKNEMD